MSIPSHTPAALDSAFTHTPRVENQTYVECGYAKPESLYAATFPGAVVPPPCPAQGGHILSVTQSIGCDTDVTAEASLLITAARGGSCMMM